ncbi:MAG: hypothetical protein Q8R57_06600 [Bacteroidota bacterium]|nr:hypothetical protein [Bacteroidota bacterium]
MIKRVLGLVLLLTIGNIGYAQFNIRGYLCPPVGAFELKEPIDLDVDFVKYRSYSVLLHDAEDGCVHGDKQILDTFGMLVSLGAKMFEFKFHDLKYGDTTFYYWKLIKESIRNTPNKTITLSFKKVYYLPADFFESMGSIDQLFVNSDSAQCDFNFLKVDTPLVDLLLNNRNTKNKSIPSNYISKIYTFNNSKILFSVTPSTYYLKTINLNMSEISNTSNFFPQLEFLLVRRCHGYASIDLNQFPNLKEIHFCGKSWKRKFIINVSGIRNKGPISSSFKAMTYDGDYFEKPPLFSSKKSRVRRYYYKNLVFKNDYLLVESKMIKFVGVKIDKKICKKLMLNKDIYGLLIIGSKLYFNNEMLNFLKTIKGTLLIDKDCRIINKTSFTLEEIKKQLPNCKFN